MPARTKAPDQTVVIPIRIVSGEFRFLYGGTIPALSDGIAELRVPAHMVRDRAMLELIRAERTIEFLPKGTTILLAMRQSHVSPLQASAIPSPGRVDPPGPFVYVPAVLLGSARLLLKGTKDAELVEVRCKVTGVSQEASSINHAYTLASKVYEPGRRTNVGNVFDLVYFLDKDNVWKPLRVLRGRHEAEFELRFRGTGSSRASE